MSKNGQYSRASVSDVSAEAGPRRARIGVPIPIESAAWRVWEGRAYLLSLGYVAQLQRAGASVMLLPVPEPGERELGGEARDLLETLDGLVIAGGPDVDPAHYQESASPVAGPFDAARDDWELALLAAATESDTPVLGICRGLQLINVFRGGSLIQHLPHRIGSEAHNPTVGVFGDHNVRTLPGSWLRDAVGEVADVATYHHQAIDMLGEGLAITASAEDGTIEGVEDLDRGFIGVQWHPEVRDHTGVLGRFAWLCAERMRSTKTERL